MRPGVLDTGPVDGVEFEFSGPVIEWRGPSPYYFLEIPESESEDIKFAAKGLEYWGQVPVAVEIGETDFFTALFPKGGRYLLPLKAAVRDGLGLDVGDVIDAVLRLGQSDG